MANSPEVDLAVKRAWEIPGLYRREEAAFLYKLARRRGTLVEVGCWMGRTTSLLCRAALVWGAHVVTVDPFVPIPHEQATPERWRANLVKVGLTPPTLLEMTSDAAANAWDGGEIALVFIDGAHDHGSVISDLWSWTKFVKVGGVVALHDMFYPSITGVASAVAEWWEAERGEVNDPKWELRGLHDFTIAFERIR